MEKAKQWVEMQGARGQSALGAKLHILDGAGEGYVASIKKGGLHIKAASPLAAAFALNQASLYHAAGHLADCLGEVTPKFSLRALWLEPERVREENIERLCQRTIELGYNTWILGAHCGGMFVQESQPPLACKGMHKTLKQYGLRLALKPRIVRTFGGAAVCPLDHSYRQELANALDDFLIETEGCDALYWESPCLTPGFENNPSARDCLKSDLVIKELRMLEEILGCRTQLIYYLPASCFSEAAEQSEWMAELCDAAGKNTVIAFPAAGGQLSDDHAAPHPFWKELRRSPDISSTRLMPVINCGGIEQGEGLWPNLPMDLIQTYLPRCYRHTFAGIAIPCPALPGEGSFLEGALWIASQAQWRDLPAELLAETWHAARRPSEEYGESKIRLENIREVIKGISSLRQLVNQKARSLIPTAENRAKVERVIALIKLLDCQLSASGIPAMQDHPPTLDDYQLYFLRDAKRMTAYLAQHLSVPTPHLLQGQDLGEGFWTDIAYNAFRRDVPRQGNPGSKMARIFLENRFEF